jgi:hypothetical protein
VTAVPVPGGADREATARQLLAAVRLRAELGYRAGIVRVWQSSDPERARHDLAAGHGAVRRGASARRTIAVVDAAADSRADPDMMWD